MRSRKERERVRHSVTLGVLNFQGSNLGRSVTPARTSGLSSPQGMVRDRAVKVSCSQSYVSEHGTCIGLVQLPRQEL